MAYEELVRRYQDVAVRTAHVIAPAADADDAAQEAFVKAWIALPRFRAGAPFRPWLLQIVANEARHRRRSAPPRDSLERREAEAADVLRIPRGTVKSRLSRALGRLRDHLTGVEA